MKILGVKIDNLARQEILEKVEFFLDSNGMHQIATINPEFLLKAQKDAEFRNILNKTDLNVADGIGIYFAFLRFGKKLKARITGVDLIEDILQLAEKKKMSIFLVGDKKGLSSWQETRDIILEKYPRLEIAGIDLGTKSPRGDLVPNADIVFCALGAPRQEKFIHSLKSSKSAKIRLAIGVGGSFDFLTRKVRRAPKFLRKVGLEWLWRLIQEPKYRAKRIFSAVIIFPIRVIFNK